MALLGRGLVARQSTQDQSLSNTTKIGIISTVALLGIFVAAFILLGTLRALRLSGRKPSLLPGSYLKNKWNNWRPNGVYVEVSRTNLDERHPYDPGALEELRPTTTRESENSTLPALPPTHETGTGIMGRMSTLRRAVTRAAGGVDRNTSVRSVMTLPRYSPMANENEEVLGREGERDGIDEIIVFPETAEEELERYNDEAEELYQIRVARRRENIERRERQAARRAAREAGDQATLRQLQAEARRRNEAAAEDPASSSTLIANRQGSRERRVSAVSYASLGVAHHDGSRVRRSSGESERPLMDSASGMSMGRSSRATSMSSQVTLPQQPVTEASVLDSSNSNDASSPGVQRTGTLPPVYTEQPLHGHSSTSSLSLTTQTPGTEGRSSSSPRNEQRRSAASPPVQSPPVASPHTPVIRINDGQQGHPSPQREDYWQQQPPRYPPS